MPSIKFDKARIKKLIVLLLLACKNHYTVELLNIAVSGVNVTTPAVFDLSTTGGVIMDSGTTLTYLVQPAFGQFQAGVGACLLILFESFAPNVCVKMLQELVVLIFVI
jgi:hypothetical protein